MARETNRQRTERQLQNCLLALLIWQQDVKPRHVDLGDWKCGTKACFGGHLTTWPEFRAKGVRSDREASPPEEYAGMSRDWGNAPVLVDQNGTKVATLPCTVASELFGDGSLFRSSDGEEGVSHHQQVVNRLQNQINRLAAQL
jgi:hypothetical protein